MSFIVTQHEVATLANQTSNAVSARSAFGFPAMAGMIVFYLQPLPFGPLIWSSRVYPAYLTATLLRPPKTNEVLHSDMVAKENCNQVARKVLVFQLNTPFAITLAVFTAVHFM